MSNNEIFMVGDKVFYTGSKYADRLNGKPGWLHAPVIDQPGSWVVEFPETRSSKDRTDSDDYIMSVRVLTKQHHAAPAAEHKKQEGPEVQPRRRKRDPDEE
jgi:hypothetical protein